MNALTFKIIRLSRRKSRNFVPAKTVYTAGTLLRTLVGREKKKLKPVYSALTWATPLATAGQQLTSVCSQSRRKTDVYNFCEVIDILILHFLTSLKKNGTYLLAYINQSIYTVIHIFASHFKECFILLLFAVSLAINRLGTNR